MLRTRRENTQHRDIVIHCFLSHRTRAKQNRSTKSQNKKVQKQCPKQPNLGGWPRRLRAQEPGKQFRRQPIEPTVTEDLRRPTAKQWRRLAETDSWCDPSDPPAETDGCMQATECWSGSPEPPAETRKCWRGSPEPPVGNRHRASRYGGPWLRQS